MKVGPERQFVDRFAGTGGQIPAGLFLCAGAVIESHRLAMGFPADIFSRMRKEKVPRHPQSNSKPLPRCPNAGPGGPRCAPRLPKVPQRDTKGSAKSNTRNAMWSRKQAWAFQSEFKGGIYPPKLPINRSSGHFSYRCLSFWYCFIWVHESMFVGAVHFS